MIKIYINQEPHLWPRESITGAEIKKLAKVPDWWVVNCKVRVGEDPELGHEESTLLPITEPAKFVVRNPGTSQS